jgi:thiol-disulfide isomerase/thioredoxin
MRAPALVLFGGLLALASSASAAEVPPKFVVHEVPKPLPDVRFADGDGRPRALADFRGRVVLLNLWATWCAPCRREMPTLDRLQAVLGGPDFEVVALSIDRAGIDAVRKFYGEVGVKHLVLYNDGTGKAAGALGAVGVPTTLLIDRDGREIGRLAGTAEWDAPEMMAFIRRHLAKQSGSLAPALRGRASIHTGTLPPMRQPTEPIHDPDPTA